MTLVYWPSTIPVGSNLDTRTGQDRRASRSETATHYTCEDSLSDKGLRNYNANKIAGLAVSLRYGWDKMEYLDFRQFPKNEIYF